MQENTRKTLWLNIYSLKSRISFNVLLIVFTLLLFLGYTINRLSLYVELSRTIGERIEEVEQLSSNLLNYVEQSNHISQNQLINENNDNSALRRKIWTDKILPILNNFEAIQSTWVSSELKLKLATLELNLKKLQKDQNAVESVLDKEIETRYFQEQSNAGRVSSKAIYNRNIVPVIGQLNRLFEDFANLRREEYAQQRADLEARITYFWIYIGVLSVIAVASIVFAGWNVAQHAGKRFAQLYEYTKVLKNGNLIPHIELPPDETYPIVAHLQTLNQELDAIKSITENVKEGKLSKKIQVFDQEGELGSALSQMQDNLQEVAQRDFQRNWNNEGIALFGNLLRQYNDAQALYDLLVTNLVSYLKANQGGIFILDDRNERKPILNLMSIYAFDRKRVQENQIQPGQGLVGQAWKEKETIYIEQTSEDYLKITSGLGGAKPRSLLIVPMVNNDLKVLGVLELASFHNFKTYEIEFVKRVAEMIVSAISSIKNNEKNRILLAEAQRVTDQMRSKEEEMRKNLVRLMGTQEEMRRNQAELNAKTDAINATMATAEIELNGKIMETNKIFTDTLLYHTDELKEQNFEMLVGANHSSDFREYWERIYKGEIIQTQLTLCKKGGDPVWFNTTFTPIKNRAGKLYKVIFMATNITEEHINSLYYESQLSAIHRFNAVIEFDTHGFILDANEIYLELLGYRHEELVGKHHSVVLPEYDRESDTFITFWDRLSRGESMQGRYCRLHRSGKEVWIRGSYNAVLDFEGKTLRIINIAQDISTEVREEQKIQKKLIDLETEKIQFEEKYKVLFTQNQEIQQLLDQQKVQKRQIEYQQQELIEQLNALNTSLTFVEFAIDGTLLNANDLFLKTTKYKLSEIKGMHYTQLFKDTSNQQVQFEVFWEKIKYGLPQPYQLQRIARNNEQYWLYAAYTLLKDKSGKAYKVIQLAIPMTNQQVEELSLD